MFSLLHYFTTIPAMSSNALTLVTLFLPLSSLWASTSVGGPSNPGADERGNVARRRRKFFDRFHVRSRGPLIAEKNLDSPSSVAITHGSQESTLASPVKAGHGDCYRDLEAQDMMFRGTNEKI